MGPYIWANFLQFPGWSLRSWIPFARTADAIQEEGRDIPSDHDTVPRSFDDDDPNYPLIMV